MSNETSNNGSKISIVVLVIALIGSWIYFVNTNNTKTEIITNYTAEVAVLDSTKNSIQADFIAASAKVDSLNQENTGLQGELHEKSVAIQKLKMNISNILRKKEATDKELAEAKSMIAELNGKVAGLFTDLAKAQEENKVLTVKNEVLTTENTNLNTNLTSTTKEKERLQDIGIQALTIHGRTRKQMYKGEADWSYLNLVKDNPRLHIPVFGNGDIDSPEKAAEYRTKYNVDGMMIGRASIGYPWIFNEIKHYFATGEKLSPPDLNERIAVAKKHLDFSVEWKGEKQGILEMRRHYTNYFRGMPNFKPYRSQMVTAETYEEVAALLEEVGEVFADYQF